MEYEASWTENTGPLGSPKLNLRDFPCNPFVRSPGCSAKRPTTHSARDDVHVFGWLARSRPGSKAASRFTYRPASLAGRSPP